MLLQSLVRTSQRFYDSFRFAEAIVLTRLQAYTYSCNQNAQSSSHTDSQGSRTAGYPFPGPSRHTALLEAVCTVLGPEGIQKLNIAHAGRNSRTALLSSEGASVQQHLPYLHHR